LRESSTEKRPFPILRGKTGRNIEKKKEDPPGLKAANVALATSGGGKKKEGNPAEISLLVKITEDTRRGRVAASKNKS